MLRTSSVRQENLSGQKFLSSEESTARTHRVRGLSIFLFFCGVFSFLYLNLFRWPGVPIFRFGDENFFWVYASRMRSGEQFLRDFHQFTPPGVNLCYLAFFRLFGESVRSTSWSVLCLGFALTLVCFLVARQLMRLAMAMLTALACAVLLYGDRFDATHHWFSSLAAVLAVWSLFPSRSKTRIVLAGSLLALSAFCTQTAGAMATLACCLALMLEHRLGDVSWRLVARRITLLLISEISVWTLLSWRYLLAAGAGRYWYFQVLYPSRYVHFPDGFLFPRFGPPHHLRSWISFTDHLFVYFLILLILPAVVLFVRRRPASPKHTMPVALLTSLSVFLTLEIITRLNWNRMHAIAMPALILLAWMVSQRVKTERVLMPLGWGLLGVLALAIVVTTQLHPYQQITLPTGQAMMEPEDLVEADWLMRHTAAGDRFLEVAHMRFYLPLQLREVGASDVLLPYEVTLPEWVTETVKDLREQKVEYILWAPRMGIFHVGDPPASQIDTLGPLRTYMRSAYVRVKLFDNGDEIWERVAEARTAVPLRDTSR
ncbi:hypothetical protein [Granulicella sp. S190]|uniref:hypothetical protein n=1 Tax=Granulicella sp. S190 TaxID=1747226 RepID=UPI00131CDB49|nr:hypothetical protein [Granulicella sp. S190]